MLEKNKRIFRADKLRKNLLYEADSNQNNKYVRRDMMRKTEKAKLLAKGQYRSRKRKAAIHHALNKRLIFEMLLRKRKKAVV